MGYREYLERWFGKFEEYRATGEGKGVRGQLVLAINPKEERLAAIVEAIHTASLLHDDVIDRAETRRGRPSVNAQFGEFTSVMLGDLLYSRAFAELTSYPEPVARKIAESVYLLAEGELEDVKLSRGLNLDLDRYFQMVYKKTGALIEGACWSSSYLRGWDPEPFGRYGRNLGIAFQLIDDLLDLVGDPAVTGKPTFEDFAEGKCTYPYLLLFQQLPPTEREQLKGLYRRTPTDRERRWILEQLERYQIPAQVRERARELVEEGVAGIRRYPVPELVELAEQLLKRER
jgi:octaprenyl-diphosphate synthase